MGRRTALRALVLLVAAVAAVAVAGMLWAWPAHAAVTTVNRGPADRPRIALTFDDNYQPARALAILGILKRYDVDATVFVVGQAVPAYPSINRALMDPHFEVADHTRTHRLLVGMSWFGLMQEVGAGAAAFRAATGKRTVPLFRPTYGSVSSAVAAAATDRDYLYITLWDIDTNDWQGRSASAIRSTVLANAHSGAIVLMHLSAPHTAEALPGIITTLRARGYQLVSLSELLKGGRRFIDVDQGSSVGRAVLRLVAQGVMSGYDKNYFGPVDAMTRAQFAKVAVMVGGLHTGQVERADSPTFVDVPVLRDEGGAPLAYPFDFIEEAAAAGLVQGRAGAAGQVFDPRRSINRLQLAQVVARMARELKHYPESAEGPRFADVPGYAASDVALTARLGLMKGYTSQRFDPWSPAMRGHVAVVMTRFQDLPAYVEPPPPEPPPTEPPLELPAPSTEPTSSPGS